MSKQREETVWGELITYSEGGRITSKRLPKATLDHFALMEELFYFVREKTDDSLHYSLTIPRGLTRQAIQHAHELSGHLGQKEKNIKKPEEMFYWANLKVDMCDYVKKCITCQRFKGESGLQQKWKELPPVSKPLERVGIDLTDMVAGFHGFRYALTVVDHYSRFVRFFPLKPNTPHISHTHYSSTWQTAGPFEASYLTTEESSPAESSNSSATSITSLSTIPPPTTPKVTASRRECIGPSRRSSPPSVRATLSAGPSYVYPVRSP